MDSLRSRRDARALPGIALALLCTTPLASVDADVIRVPADYGTVYAALEAAVSGDSVLVSPGDYFETEILTIDAGVTLLGDGDVEDIWIWLFEGMTFAPGPGPARLEGVSVRADTATRLNVIHAENAQCEIINNLFVDEYFHGDAGSLILGTGGGTVTGNRLESGRAICVRLSDGGPWVFTWNTFAIACVLGGEPGLQLDVMPEVTSLIVRQNTFSLASSFAGVEFEVVNNVFYDLIVISCFPEQSDSIHHNLFYPWSDSGTGCFPEGGGEGNLWATDPEFCDASICDYRLSPTSPAIGAGENGENLGAWPVGCAVTGVEGADSQALSVSRPFPNPSTNSVALDLAPDVTAVVVLDVAGRTVRRLHVEPGDEFAIWDGLNSNGEDVGPGVYFLRVERGDREVVTHRVVMR